MDEQPSLGTGPPKLRHRAQLLEHLDRTRHLGGVLRPERARPPELPLQQRRPVADGPLQGDFADLLRHLTVQVADQADAALHHLHRHAARARKLEVGVVIDIAGEVRPPEPVDVPRGKPGEDGFHRPRGGRGEAAVAASPADVEPDHESAQPIAGGMTARVVPCVDRSPEHRDRLVPPPEREQRHSPPGEKMQRRIRGLAGQQPRDHLGRIAISSREVAHQVRHPRDHRVGVQPLVEAELVLELEPLVRRVARALPVGDGLGASGERVEGDALELRVVEHSRDRDRPVGVALGVGDVIVRRLAYALDPEREERVGGQEPPDRMWIRCTREQLAPFRAQLGHPFLRGPVADGSGPSRGDHQHPGQRPEPIVNRRVGGLVVLERHPVFLQAGVSGRQVADPLVQAWQQAAVDEVERGPEVPHGFRRGRRRHCHIGCPDEPPGGLAADLRRRLGLRFDRGVQHGSLAIVKSEDLGEGGFALARRRLAPTRRLRMQPRALGPRKRAVGDLLDQDVAK